MPQRFGLSYMGADNAEHTPYVIHRALLGSLERFIGILTEHYGGAFPFWLAPVQVRVLPVGRGPPRRGPARSPPARPATASRSTTRDETVGKRIRNAELDKIPFVVVYGDKESDESLAVRERGGGQSTTSLAGAARIACYACRPDKQGRNRLSPPGPTARRRRFNRSG